MADQGLLSGQVLGGKYLLGERLGKGGFAEVYKAENKLLNRPQAIKVLLEHHQGNAKFRERFIREAQTLAALDHPNIVPIHDFGFEGNRGYLVMPFLSGGTLQDKLTRHNGPLSLEEALRYLKPICTSLEYAHFRSIVHLDLKPLNVLIHQDGRLFLSDFGLAHFISQKAAQGGPSLLFGTPHYMAPEHSTGQPGQHSDLYSLGVIAYRMLTGYLPFDGLTPVAISLKHLNDQPPPLHVKNPTIPPAVEKVVLKALAKDPKDRFANVQEFTLALEQANEQNPISEKPSRGTTLVTYRGHSNRIQAVAWSPNKQYIASAGNDGDVHVWKTATGKNVITYLGHRHARGASDVYAVAWSPDGKYIASGGSDKTAQVWDAATGQCLLTYRGHSDYVTDLAWSHNGKRIASCSWDETVQVWDAATGAHPFIYHSYATLYALAWSPDGTYIASGGNDGLTRIWYIVNGKMVSSYRAHASSVYSLAWSSDNKRLASGGEQAARIWEATRGNSLVTYNDHTAEVRAVAWSPDGKHIASASLDKTVQVWDGDTGGHVFTYPLHDNGVLAVAWSPDGKLIASASADKTVQVWQAV